MQAPRPRSAHRHAVPALVAVALLALFGGAVAASRSSQEKRPVAIVGAAADVADAGALGASATPRPLLHNATIDGRLKVVPSAAAIRRAWRFARRSPGVVSAAVVDSRGRLRALRGERSFVAASVAKGFMLAAVLRRLAAAGEELDGGTAATLRAMITVSDNRAAESIYASLGDDPIEAAARAGGAGGVDVRGWWSETYLGANDAARFMRRVRRVVPGRFREFAMGLLAGIAPEQRWGIPVAAGPSWRVWFKGGWRNTARGALTHQMALLRGRHRLLAIAVLTDAMPSMAAGIETIEGVARRLLPRHLSSDRPPSSGSAAPGS